MVDTVTITPADGVVDILGKTYTVTACINLTDGRRIPVADFPMMSDERWNELVAQSKARHPELYEQAVKA